MTSTAHSSDEVAALVARYGLQRAGARLPLGTYTRQLWARRHFITEFSTASNAVGFSRSFLGQAWQLLTPLLNVAVYYLIFGVLLHTKRGVDNFIAFLTIGLFVFSFTSGSLTAGARAISGNLGLTRSLHFPRAVLPVSTTLTALQQLVSSMVIMVPVVLLTGEPLSLRWFLLIPAVGLQAAFSLGLAFLFARLGARVPDTSQMLPFITRVWMYTSGVMYSITEFTKGRPHWVKTVLEVNPGAVYVNVARNALLTNNPVHPYTWPLAIGWAIVALGAGYLIFWQGEEEYGRV
ncbi:ABC transporter permease [Jatrophihabitans cynanchi]|uniref:Transport permease protein n=1 Tax=Jatrophihabitans cynanchi TaxID=2944128 RepID=A0ABY7JYZ5_9ACTN|nr:ABC transporter permease [Jatrophihabitans sp. SB3-54]WAX57790.1 ABC transporter permease [Jatrophihabitans sp. SB3-54]